ncbi:MAG TPA: ABC transporter ATP-binding protein [Anaerolineae bacterium]|nr:ABC transporter ATP-binding protein [Anaerolineae bacterium]HQK15091.1 ABC transporter ATP-binding protein [Anaerolineae bacterium]
MIVEARELVKIYPMGKVEVQALRGVTLGIEAGAFISVMGPSGSGKSTLLNILGCMDRPTAGMVLLDGVDLGKVKPRQLPRIRREKVGFVFQQYQLLSHLTALENVMLPLRYADTGYRAARKRALDALEQVGLADRAHHRPTELSGGQQQRVAIARALINHPAIVLADEPTGNLDSKSGDEILHLMRQLNEAGQTFIIVTHDPRVAERTDRTIYLRDGAVESEVTRV